MWELDHKESWEPKNWCFWIVVLEKTLESPLDSKEIKPDWRKSTLNIHWKDWCWSSNTLATWCEEPTHWKRPWCWERLKVKEKIPWMGEPGGLQSMGSQRVRHDWATSFHFSLSCIGEGNGNPLQCSCLENPRDSRAWWAAVYGAAQSRTRLKRLSSSSSSMAKISIDWKKVASSDHQYFKSSLISQNTWWIMEWIKSFMGPFICMEALLGKIMLNMASTEKVPSGSDQETPTMNYWCANVENVPFLSYWFWDMLITQDSHWMRGRVLG